MTQLVYDGSPSYDPGEKLRFDAAAVEAKSASVPIR